MRKQDERTTPRNAEPPPPASTKPRRRRWWKPALLLLVTYLLYLLVIDGYGHRDEAVRANYPHAIIILGAQVMPGGQPGNSLRMRTLKAVDLYHQGVADTIICTGGLGDNAPTEAKAAADLAIALGVPEKAILLETHSTSTRENARFAAEICRARHWSRVVVVSDPYHLLRAKLHFSREKLTVYTSPAPGVIRDEQIGLRFTWTARESLLLIRDVLWR